MPSASLVTSINANMGSAQSDGRDRTNVQFTAAVMRKAQELFPVKITAEMAFRTKCGLRTAEHWKANTREMDIADYINLLQSDKLKCEDGVAFLDVFWEFVPEHVRDRWLQRQYLNQRLDNAEKKRAARRSAEDREIEQLRLELKQR